MVEANTKDSVPGIGNWPVFSKPVRGNHKAPLVLYAALASVAALAKKFYLVLSKPGWLLLGNSRKIMLPNASFSGVFHQLVTKLRLVTSAYEAE